MRSAAGFAAGKAAIVQLVSISEALMKHRLAQIPDDGSTASES
jgi:hypothetical protein